MDLLFLMGTARFQSWTASPRRPGPAPKGSNHCPAGQTPIDALHSRPCVIGDHLSRAAMKFESLSIRVRRANAELVLAHLHSYV